MSTPTPHADPDGAGARGDEQRPLLRLTETSYIVLGLLEDLAPATPYDLKQAASVSTFNFYRVPHTQLYTECARLAEAGLLSEEQEQGGRRRRVYQLTSAGRGALAEWRAQPAEGPVELRDSGILKLFFGSDPAMLAQGQLRAHQAQLAAYEALREELRDGPERWRLALESGIGHEREFVRFWSALAEGKDPGS
jgi:DNA-binding PadR family transcriptional regulator